METLTHAERHSAIRTPELLKIVLYGPSLDAGPAEEEILQHTRFIANLVLRLALALGTNPIRRERNHLVCGVNRTRFDLDVLRFPSRLLPFSQVNPVALII